MREYDFLVVGTGISGLSFALKAAEYGTVAVLTKRKSENSTHKLKATETDRQRQRQRQIDIL